MTPEMAVAISAALGFAAIVASIITSRRGGVSFLDELVLARGKVAELTAELDSVMASMARRTQEWEAKEQTWEAKERTWEREREDLKRRVRDLEGTVRGLSEALGRGFATFGADGARATGPTDLRAGAMRRWVVTHYTLEQLLPIASDLGLEAPSKSDPYETAVANFLDNAARNGLLEAVKVRVKAGRPNVAPWRE